MLRPGQASTEASFRGLAFISIKLVYSKVTSFYGYHGASDYNFYVSYFVAFTTLGPTLRKFSERAPQYKLYANSTYPLKGMSHMHRLGRRGGHGDTKAPPLHWGAARARRGGRGTGFSMVMALQKS